MTKMKSQGHSSDEESCRTKNKSVLTQKTGYPYSALYSRTPYEIYWLQYYNQKASEVNYDLVHHEKENSVEHYRENMCLAPDCSTQLSTEMEGNQLWLTIDGPNGPYQLPTWDSKSEYYQLGLNDTIILTYTQGGQSIGLAISGNDLSYQLYIFATCGNWYLLNNRSYPNTFYGSYSNSTFIPDNISAAGKLTETGGSSDNPIQAMVLLQNTCDDNGSYVYINYYTENGSTYIYCFGGNIL